MILTCPNCATRFTVDPGIFGGSPRKVRCTRCRHIWRQGPVAEPKPAEPPPPPAPPPPPPQPAAPPPPPPPPPPQPAAPPPPPPPPPTPEQMFPSDTFDLPGSDSGLDDDPPPLRAPFEDAEDALDEDAGEAAIERRRARLAESGLARKPEQSKRRGSLVWIGWLLFFLTIGSVAGGGYLARTDLVALHPPLAKLYERLGIHVEPAEWLGLELHNLKSATIIDVSETKIEVSGEVVNVGESTRAVPPIRVAMRGAGGKELAVYTLTLEDDKIAAGAKLPFNAKLPAQKEDVLDLEIAFAPLGHR